MIDANTAVFAALVGVVGAVALVKARKNHSRHTELSEIDPDGRVHEVGKETTLEGPVDVSEPAVPDRVPPEGVNVNEDSVAVWAWRIRRKENRGGDQSGTRWRTIDSGFAVGEFSVRDGWETVHVDTDSFADEQLGLLREDEDPFESANGFIDDPGQEIRLGEPDPITKRLEKWGIIGDDSLLGDVEFTLSFGRQTLTPERYQVTIIEDGDDLLVRGELEETSDGPVVRATAENPPLVSAGGLEETGAQLRSTARKQASVGVVLVLLAGGLLLSGFL